MRFWVHTSSCAALALLLAFAASANPDPPARDKNVWNYDGGIMLGTDGAIPSGPCFKVSGRVTAPGFFDDLKRIDRDSGTVFQRGKETLTQFPDHLTLAFVVYDLPCPAQLERTGSRLYLSRALMSTLHLYLYWKRGVDLRPVSDPKPKYFSVDPVLPYATALAHSLPHKFEWSYQFEIPSEGVPLTDSLVLILRTADGHIAARCAARL
jgi:hypothetical protein